MPLIGGICSSVERSSPHDTYGNKRSETRSFDLICAWTNSWTNHRDAGDLRRHGDDCDVTVIACHLSDQVGDFAACCLRSLFSLTHWGRDKMAAIFQTTFSNAFSWMKMYKFRIKFHWSLFPRFQSTIFQPLSEPTMELLTDALGLND